MTIVKVEFLVFSKSIASEILLYESPWRKPGWRFTAGCKVVAPSFQTGFILFEPPPTEQEKPGLGAVVTIKRISEDWLGLIRLLGIEILKWD